MWSSIIAELWKYVLLQMFMDNDESSYIKTAVLVDMFLFKNDHRKKGLLFKIYTKHHWKCNKYIFFFLFWILITIRNAAWAANHHIRLISGRSCDSEDRSNDAENITDHRNKLRLYFQIDNSYLKSWYYFIVLLILLYFLIKCRK